MSARLNIKDRVRQNVSELLCVDESTITDNSSFIDDLGADSLDTVELVMMVEEEFGIEIPDEEAEQVNTFSDLVRLVEKQVA